VNKGKDISFCLLRGLQVVTPIANKDLIKLKAVGLGIMKELKDWITINNERLLLAHENGFNQLFFEDREDIEGCRLLYLTDQILRFF